MPEKSLSVGGVVGGLAVLKGAALVGYAVERHRRYNRQLYHGRSRYHRGYNGRRHYRYGRSVDPDTEQDADEGKNMLLSIVGQLDPDGCILKMLCNSRRGVPPASAQRRTSSSTCSPNNTETMSSYNAAFVYAADVGTKTRDPSVCNKLFPKCSLSEQQLSGLLRRVWGCASNLFREDVEREEDFSATPPMEQPMGEERPVDEEPREEQQTSDEEQPIVDYVDDEEVDTNVLSLQDDELPRNEMFMEKLVALDDEMFLDNGMPRLELPQNAEMILGNGMPVVELPQSAEMILYNGMLLNELPQNTEMILGNGMPLVELAQNAEIILGNGMPLVELPQSAEIILSNGVPLLELAPLVDLAQTAEMMLGNGIPLNELPLNAEMIFGNGLPLVDLAQTAEMMLGNGIPLNELPLNAEMILGMVYLLELP
ncbi:hypothetical protein C7M84_022365 [Penaeus vannamei]|uniref:Uncharacterized protein n=1 Tax=Penaeus vannamei TaxID=6689 RepID=A0A423U6V3_PENVA|nr:hypothetical protein C7M84_022365 [Penaeus vannamei]